MAWKDLRAEIEEELGQLETDIQFGVGMRNLLKARKAYGDFSPAEKRASIEASRRWRAAQPKKRGAPRTKEEKNEYCKAWRLARKAKGLPTGGGASPGCKGYPRTQEQKARRAARGRWKTYCKGVESPLSFEAWLADQTVSVPTNSAACTAPA